MARPMGSEITKLQQNAIDKICADIRTSRDEDGNARVEVGRGRVKAVLILDKLGTAIGVKPIEGKLGRPAQTENTVSATPKQNHPENGTTQKRRPGRPRKMETANKPRTIRRKKRGRPVGSKNKNTAATTKA